MPVNFGPSTPINFFDPNGSAPALLAGHSTVPNMSFGLPGGGSGSGNSSGGGHDASGLIEAGVPLLMSLFGPKNKEAAAATGDVNNLSGMADSLFKGGQSLTEEGKAALAPVIKYLTAVAGGDPTALFEATAPERKRVLDQYDTAKQALQFEGRGGGRASGVLNLEASKASDLSNVVALARRQGVSDLAGLGAAMTGQGISESATGASAQNAVAANRQRMAEETNRQHAALGAGIGKTIAAALPFVLGFL